MNRALLRAGLLLSASLPALAGAQTSVFLDFSNFDARLDEAFADAGIAALNATERADMRTNLRNRLESIYGNYTVDFTPTAPVSGNFERIVFGASTTNAGLYGQAAGIDWRNRSKNDSADVYTRNFSDFLNPSFSRATNIQNITGSLSRTAAHEFGHNVGLSHYDCYGYGLCNSVNGYTTTGQQNTYFMGTGQTGATFNDRTQFASINTLMNVKLEYADGLSPDLGLTISETMAANDTRATAQALTFKELSIAGIPVVNVEGALSTGDVDFFSFQSFAGAAITANILARDVALPGSGNLDSMLTLYDSAGNVLFTNDDLTFLNNQFYVANGGRYGLDSLILNYIAPTTGTYYVGISGFNSTAGNYNLLLHPVPEPAAVAVLSIGVLAVLRRRRRA